MLHNRRKAEIEVLTSSSSATMLSASASELIVEAISCYPSPLLVSAFSSRRRPCESHFRVSDRRSPLVQYVVLKLREFVATSTSEA